MTVHASEANPNSLDLARQSIFSLNGRETRSEFWIFYTGFFWITGFVQQEWATDILVIAFPPALGTWLLIIFVKCLLTWGTVAVAVKRFHDRDKSGWWILIIFVPIFGIIWLLFECAFLPGTAGANKYGLAAKSTGSRRTLNNKY